MAKEIPEKMQLKVRNAIATVEGAKGKLEKENNDENKKELATAHKKLLQIKARMSFAVAKMFFGVKRRVAYLETRRDASNEWHNIAIADAKKRDGAAKMVQKLGVSDAKAKILAQLAEVEEIEKAEAARTAQAA